MSSPPRRLKRLDAFRLRPCGLARYRNRYNWKINHSAAFEALAMMASRLFFHSANISMAEGSSIRTDQQPRSVCTPTYQRAFSSLPRSATLMSPRTRSISALIDGCGAAASSATMAYQQEHLQCAHTMFVGGSIIRQVSDCCQSLSNCAQAWLRGAVHRGDGGYRSLAQPLKSS